MSLFERFSEPANIPIPGRGRLCAATVSGLSRFFHQHQVCDKSGVNTLPCGTSRKGSLQFIQTLVQEELKAFGLSWIGFQRCVQCLMKGLAELPASALDSPPVHPG